MAAMAPSLPRCASRCNCATSARSSDTWTELPGRSESHPNLRPDEPCALIPQAARQVVVERRRVGALANLADNVAAVERCRIGDRRQKQRGLGPFLRNALDYVPRRVDARHAPPVGPDRRVLGPFLPSRAVASQCQRAGSGVIDGTSRTISEALDLNPIFAGVVCPNADRQNASRATRAFATAAA